MKTALPALILLLALAGCGGDRAEKVSDQLEEAAEQSTPAAAEVLEESADRIEEREGIAPAGEPGSAAQQALERAGDAQVETLPEPVEPPAN